MKSQVKMEPSSWKHSFFTFVVRQALCNVLSPESLSRLSECMRLSLTGGHFVLNDVVLNCDYLNKTMLLHIGEDGLFFEVVHASISKLVITLKTSDEDANGGNELTSGKNFFRRQSSMVSALIRQNVAAKLRVQIEIHGLKVDIYPSGARSDQPGNPNEITRKEANNFRKNGIAMNTSTDSNSSSSPDGGYFAPYVEAIISSLQAKIVDTRIRIFDRKRDLNLCFSLGSLSYHDLTSGLKTDNSGAKFSAKLIMHKVIDFSNFQIYLSHYNGEKTEIDHGTTNFLKYTKHSTSSAIIFETEKHGNGNVCLRVSKCAKNNIPENEENSFDIHHDVDVTLDQRWRLMINAEQFLYLNRVLEDICYRPSPNENNKNESIIDDEILENVENISSQCNEFNTEEVRTSDVVMDTAAVCGQTYNLYNISQNGNQASNCLSKQYAEAKFYAHKKEVVGGILISTKHGDREEIDAFFDCQDKSFSTYLSLVGSSCERESINDVASNHTSFKSCVKTQVKVQLLELCVMIGFDTSRDEHADNVAGTFNEEAHILLTVSELIMSASLNNGMESNAQASICYLDIISFPHGQSNDSECLLRFIENKFEHVDCLVSAPPHISLSIKAIPKNVGNADKVQMEWLIDASVQPLEATLLESTINGIEKFYRTVSTFDTETRSTVQNEVNVKFTTSSIQILLPLKEHQTTGCVVDGLFSRSHLTRSDLVLHQPALGMSILNFSLDFCQFADKGEILKCEAKCHTISLFAVDPNYCGTVESLSRKIEFLCLSSKVSITPVSQLKFCFTNTKHGLATAEKRPYEKNHTFPLVPSLSCVKAREDTVGDGPVRAEDPQHSMMAAAEKCSKAFSAYIPIIILDLTLHERCCIQNISESYLLNTLHDANSNISDKLSQNAMSAFSVQVMSATLILHEEDAKAAYSSTGNDNKCQSNSLFIVYDAINCHFVHSLGTGMNQIRCVAHECAIYEARVSSKQERPKSLNIAPPSLHTKERGKSGLSFAKIIFHRSNLCHPLSPATPALRVDMLKSCECDNPCNLSVHVAVYDSTYRYDPKSSWGSCLTRFILGSSISTTSNGGTYESDPSLVKLFFTISDCMIDYSTPTSYERASRAILRIGEIHMSSNLIPSAAIQAYKISVADLALHVSNDRQVYNLDNLRVNGSRHFMSLYQLHLDTHQSPFNDCHMHQTSLETCLGQMDFVPIATLDSIDVSVKTNNSLDRSKCITLPAHITLELKFGMLCLYACRDSFACLTDTINDWILHNTAVTDEELEAAHADVTCKKLASEMEEYVSTNLNVIDKGGHDCKVTLLDELDNNIFSEELSFEPMVAPSAFTSKSKIDRPFADIPDSELRATELRKKHGVIEMDDIATSFAKALLIKDFYTLNTSPCVVSPTTVNHSMNSAERTLPSQKRSSEPPLTDFLQDGHDWTTVDHDWSFKHDASTISTEQKAAWFDQNENVKETESSRSMPHVQIFPQHIPLVNNTNQIDGDDVNVKKFADPSKLAINMRIIVKDLSACCRLFDGSDWSQNLTTGGISNYHDRGNQLHTSRSKIKDKLLEDLLENDIMTETKDSIMPNNRKAACCKGRRINRFFELHVKGLQLRLDSFEPSPDHNMSSSMKLKVMNLYVLESISNSYPIKMLGAWVNDRSHPRDTNDGMVSMKVTMKVFSQ